MLLFLFHRGLNILLVHFVELIAFIDIQIKFDICLFLYCSFNSVFGRESAPIKKSPCNVPNIPVLFCDQLVNHFSYSFMNIHLPRTVLTHYHTMPHLRAKNI